MIWDGHMGRRALAKLECFIPRASSRGVVFPTMLNVAPPSSVSESESTNEDGG